MASPVFVELSIILGITVLITAVIHILRQPLIIGYIISGIVVSPYVLDLLKSQETIHAFSQFGIAILLFVVGLNLNPKTIKEVGKTSVITGLGQIIFTFSIGLLITKLLGFSWLNAAYIAIALTFSSTIIILKLLSDKHELHTLYGKIATGFLIVQDLAVVAIMLFITTAAGQGFTVNAFAMTFFELAGVLLMLFIITKFFVPILDKYVNTAHELIVIASLAWCFALASLFFELNFALETGALFAGIVLANSSIRHELSLKIKPIRDFFLVMFFIALGSTLILENITVLLVPALILSAFVLLGNPLIVLILMHKLGYSIKTSFKAGLTVAQISEFSIILVSLGIASGHVNNNILSLVTVVGLITIAASSYMIMYSDKIYSFIKPLLKLIFSEHKMHHKQMVAQKTILFGYGKMGKSIVQSLHRKRNQLLVIDNNPQIIEKLAKKEIPAHFGDIEDPNTIDELNIAKVKLFISTVASYDTNSFIINRVRSTNKKAVIIVLAQSVTDAMSLYEKGASYVLMPEFLGVSTITSLIKTNGSNVANYITHKTKHIEDLKIHHRKTSRITKNNIASKSLKKQTRINSKSKRAANKGKR